MQDRLNHQEERERAFLSHEGDCFAIYQVAENDPQRLRFMNMDWLNAHDLSVERGNYDLVYTAPLSETGSMTGGFTSCLNSSTFTVRQTSTAVHERQRHRCDKKGWHGILPLLRQRLAFRKSPAFFRPIR